MNNSALSRPWQQRYRGIRVLTVVRVQDITPMMRRVTFGGAEIEEIPDRPNLKLLIPQKGAVTPAWPVRGDDGKPKMPPGHPMPTIRTYSLRQLKREAGELDIDFVLHGHGVACTWAKYARPGDEIGLGGPFGPEVREADWYLLVGDQTALPAISRILEQLPSHARGVAFIQIPNQSEEQKLTRPPGLSVRWIHSTDGAQLEEAVRSMPWPPAQSIYAWLAGESSIVRSLRAYVRDERGLDRKEFLAIGYWRRGMSETEYHDKLDHDRGEDFYEAVRHELTHGHDDHDD